MITFYIIPRDSDLMHYGVKGMKWGVRKAYEPEYSVVSRNGDRIDMVRKKTRGLAKVLGMMSSGIRNEQDRTLDYDAYVNGERIGNLELYKESKTSMNVVWLGVDKRHRGKGYAQAILDGAAGRAKSSGFKQMTLEVPGSSPDARHIYEKQGFEAGEQISSSDDVWGGLTKMKKKL